MDLVSSLRVCRLSARGTLPTKGSAEAAGYDLYSAEEVLVPAFGRILVKTDIAVLVPEGTYGRVAPRSSLALYHSVDVAAGVIDRDYRGNIGVILVNHTDQPYQVLLGQRIAQLILEQIRTPSVLEVPDFSDFDKSGRGESGFGSTGF